MTATLKATLESSILLRPWVRIAETTGKQLGDWLRSARIMAPFLAIAEKTGGMNPS